MEHWKETDEWYTIVNHTSKHDGRAKLRVQCCRVPNQIAAARFSRRARLSREQQDRGVYKGSAARRHA